MSEQQEQYGKPCTGLEQLSSLNINLMESKVRLSGIVCTIGPATSNTAVLEQLIEAGMTIARLNFSHGSHEEHGEKITFIREAVKEYGKKMGTTYPVAIALDTKGPEIRTGILEKGYDGKIEIKAGTTIKVTVDPIYSDKCNDKIIYVNYNQLTSAAKVGTLIYISDGQIILKCTKIEHPSLHCIVESGGMLGSKKGVNIPGIKLNLPSVSEQDKEDLKFGVEKGVDIIFASFIHNIQSVRQVYDALGENGKDILVVSKIESEEALNNLDEIIDASDGIMVARGDLGVNIPPEEVFLAQKSIIVKCNRRGKPVICATQMLESMMNAPRPSRSDVADIANAILDGADGVMLSGETAVGKYPVDCVRTMAKICKKAESAIWQEKLLQELVTDIHSANNTTAISVASVMTSSLCNASAIIVNTSSKSIPRIISQYRPGCPVLMITKNGQFARQAKLFRAIYPYIYEVKDGETARSVQEQIKLVINHGKERGFLKEGDRIVTISDPNGDSSTLGRDEFILCLMSVS